METQSIAPPLSRQDMEAILAVTRALAAPFDLRTMLAEVTAAACRVLHAERSSVWLHDDAADEMVLEVASDIAQVRVSVGSGLVGACAQDWCQFTAGPYQGYVEQSRIWGAGEP